MEDITLAALILLLLALLYCKCNKREEFKSKTILASATPPHIPLTQTNPITAASTGSSTGSKLGGWRGSASHMLPDASDRYGGYHPDDNWDSFGRVPFSIVNGSYSRWGGPTPFLYSPYATVLDYDEPYKAAMEMAFLKQS